MRRVLLSAAVLLAVSSLAQAQGNQAQMAIIAHARFVAVTTEHGDVMDPKTDPDDRRVALKLQDELTKWKRFTVVTNPREADLVIAVRTARIASVYGGPQISIGNKGRGPVNSRGAVLGGEAGPSDDLLSVYAADEFPNAVPLWREDRKNGLGSPNFPSFQDFKKQVEAEDEREKAAQQPKKP